MRPRPRHLVALCALLAIVAALSLAGCGGGGGGSKRASVTVHPFVGVTAGAPLLTPQVNLARELATMRASGVTVLRVPFYWRAAQPFRNAAAVPRVFRSHFPSIQGVPTNLDLEDRIVAAAARNRIALLPVVVGSPAWAAKHGRLPNSPPAGTAAYAAFLRALIERYGPDGSLWRERPRLPKLPLRDWQIWNEPSHLAYWSDQPFAADYVKLLEAAHAAIRAADPGARTVLAGFPDRSWDLLAQVYRAGGRGAFDVAAVHPYTFEVANVLRILRLDRAAMRRAGDSRRPLWITELTWSSGKGKVRMPLGFETTEADQAARLARAIPLIARQRRALGVQRILWESWMTYDRDAGNPFDYSGLRETRPRSGDRNKPAFYAFRRAALRLAPCGSRSIPGMCP